MTDMTDAEYDALDERLTRTTPAVDFSRPGVFARQRALLDVLDKIAADYIIATAEATDCTPAEVIGNMAHREISSHLAEA
ncbi:hypothetical protein R80B4_02237 [Fibrobacteres bacterium R8-0-B4]